MFKRARIIISAAFATIASALVVQFAYATDFNADFDGGEEGASITEFWFLTAALKSVYSGDIVGPSGVPGKSLKISNEVDNKWFGGKIIEVDLGEGEEVWVRWYQYFPDDFKFANGRNGDGYGGAGMIKWLRFQYPGNSERITFEIDATPGCAQPCESALSEMIPDMIIGEGTSWKERNGNQAIFLQSPGHQKGSWHSIQMYMKLSSGSADIGDGDGLIRMWVDSNLIAEYQRNTLPTNGGNLKSVWLGNYWNGGYPNDQSFYIDDIKITSIVPATNDSNGNPYIAPISMPSAPMPPSDIYIK